MTKQMKMIMLDKELIDQLKGINASGLINSLLVKHFDIKQLSQNPELIKRRIRELELKAEYETKLKELQNGRA